MDLSRILTKFKLIYNLNNKIIIINYDRSLTHKWLTLLS
jgi:hypothetical protein